MDKPSNHKFCTRPLRFQEDFFITLANLLFPDMFQVQKDPEPVRSGAHHKLQSAPGRTEKWSLSYSNLESRGGLLFG